MEGKTIIRFRIWKRKWPCKIFDLSFNDLVKLVLIDYRGIIYEETYNSWGALSVLTDDYSLEFLNYLTKKI